MIGGGGQDTPAGVSWPPPKTAFWKFLQKRFSSHWKAVLFSIVLDVYNYSFIWQTDGNLFHQRTMIGGGGQDTPAGVSWPPPKTAFWIFLQKGFFCLWKAVLFKCTWHMQLQHYLTKPREIVKSSVNDRGWGSRYPGWDILTPTQDCILNIWRFFFFHASESLFYFQLYFQSVPMDLTNRWKFVLSSF